MTNTMYNLKEKFFKRVTVFYIAVMGLYQIVDKMYGASYIIRLNSQNISPTMIGIMFGFQEAVMLIADYPSGILSDLIGRKKVAGISMILYGIGLFVFAIAFNRILLYFIAVFIISISLALFSGSPQSWFYDVMVKHNLLERRTKVIPKIRWIVSFSSIGSAVLASFLISKSIVLPLYIGSVTAIFAGIIFLLFFEDNKGNIGDHTFSVHLIKLTKNFFSDGRMRGVVLVELSGYVGYSVFIMTWQLILLNKFNVSTSFIPIMLILLMISIMLGNFVAGKILSITNLFNTNYIGKAICLLAFAILIFSNNLYLTTVSLILYDFALGISTSASSIWINDYINSDNRSSYISAVSAIRSGAGIILFALVGLIIEHVGYGFPWIIALVFEFVSLIFLYRFVAKHKDNVEVSIHE